MHHEGAPTTGNQPTLTAAGAMKALDAAWHKSLEIGVPVNISVCDIGGNELAFLRPDGAPFMSGGIAKDKAYSVVAFNGLPTGAWHGIFSGDEPVWHGIVHRDRLVVFGGGVPVYVDGQLVGAVGCSGGSAEEDTRVATAGVQAVGTTSA